jgi:transcriptional regulator with XRE-family HTH domain
MFSVPDFLDRAKQRAGVESDYALSKLAGLSRANISNYRNGRTQPDERAIMQLCALSGDDPEHVAACIQSMRAANDDAAYLWRRIADRLQKGVGAVVMAPAVAMLLLAAAPSPAEAAPSLSPSDAASLYIMLTILRRMAERIAAVMLRKARRPGFA